MTQIVAGIFDDERTATAAARKLRGAGFDALDLDQFAVNAPGRHHGLPLGGDEHAYREKVRALREGLDRTGMPVQSSA